MENLYSLSRYIAGVYRLSKNDFNQQMAQLDIRATQSDVLLFISEHNGLDQKSIAKQMAVTPGLATKDLQILEEQGLIIREIDSQDSRRYRIFITDSGTELVGKLQEIMNQWWSKQLTPPNGIDQPTLFMRQLQTLYQELIHLNEVKSR